MLWPHLNQLNMYSSWNSFEHKVITEKSDYLYFVSKELSNVQNLYLPHGFAMHPSYSKPLSMKKGDFPNCLFCSNHLVLCQLHTVLIFVGLYSGLMCDRKVLLHMTLPFQNVLGYFRMFA